MKLQIEPAEGAAFVYPFDQDSLIIGRASSSDLALPDPFLSRHHARLFRQGDRVLVEDLGSRNGTHLNGVAVLSPTPIQTGDVLSVSGSRITVCAPDQYAQDSEPSNDIGATIYRSARELLRQVQNTGPPDKEHDLESLRRYTTRLRLVNEVHEALSTSIELDPLLHLILDRAFEHLQPEQGALFLKRGGEYSRVASRSLDPRRQEMPLSRSLLEEVCDKGMAALVLDAENDERFSAAQSLILSGLRSLIAAPLLDSQGSLGMIVLSATAGVREFAPDDLELLVTLASIAALKIRNAALTEEVLARQRLEQDLALARRIQESLLPTALPELEGLELFSRNVPSRGVSGDYYQVVSRRDGRECVFLICDVSGKGIPASLLTASLEALCAAPIDAGNGPAEVCSIVSRHLHRRTPPEKYATAFLGVLDLETGVLEYTNAGHNPALLIAADGSVRQLEPKSMPLGLIGNATYTTQSVGFGAGDLLVLYTDGITEAENEQGEEYGLERLIATAVSHRDAKLAALADAVDEDVDFFTNQAPPGDDQTLLLARRADEV